MAKMNSKKRGRSIKVVLPSIESCFSSSQNTTLRLLRAYVACRFELLEEFDTVLSDAARCRYYNDIARATAFAYYVAKHGPIKYDEK